MQGSADEPDGKLYFHGTVATQDEANKIWDAIKTIPIDARRGERQVLKIPQTANRS